jgi:hypothetical protein
VFSIQRLSANALAVLACLRILGKRQYRPIASCGKPRASSEKKDATVDVAAQFHRRAKASSAQGVRVRDD